MVSSYFEVNEKDIEILRNLGWRIHEIGNLPVMQEKRQLWKKLNSLHAERPMILTETQGVLDEVIPMSSLECEGEWARQVERGLREKIFYHEVIGDDMVIEPRITYGHKVITGDYGVQVVKHIGNTGHGMGSYRWDPPIKDIEQELSKLHFRERQIDDEATNRNKELLEEVFAGILPVIRQEFYWWTTGLTWDCIDLVGLEGFMLAMYDQPEGLHALMGFLRDEYLTMIAWYEKNGLLLPNNEDDYIGSGGRGYTDELPKKALLEGRSPGVQDMWGLSESQETVGVSPGMFEEFVFQYQLPIISKFGLACYGCCEPLEKRWHIIRNIPNLRRVSVSPWANQEKMAEYLGRHYVYSRKPHPALVSMEQFDEEAIRDDIRKTLDITKGLNVEIVLKDVHTLSHDPRRLGRWTEIARETISEYYD